MSKECPDCSSKMKIVETILFDIDGNTVNINTKECSGCSYVEYPSFNE